MIALLVGEAAKEIAKQVAIAGLSAAAAELAKWGVDELRGVLAHGASKGPTKGRARKARGPRGKP